MRTIKPFLMVAALSVMAACSATTPPPAVEVRTVEVVKPVAITCVDKVNIPDEPPKIGGRLTGDARRDLDLTAASAIRLRSWGRTLTAMLSGCAK